MFLKDTDGCEIKMDKFNIKETYEALARNFRTSII